MTWSSYSIITIIDTFTSLQSVAFGVCVRCKCRAREVNAIVKDDDDGALTCAIKVENERLACGFCLFPPTGRGAAQTGSVATMEGRKSKTIHFFLLTKKMRRKSVTKVLLGHFQAYFFLCVLYLCFVFRGLKSYYILPKTLLCSYFNVVMVLYAIYYLFIQVYEVLM